MRARSLAPCLAVLPALLLVAGPLAAGADDLATRRFDVGTLVEGRPHARGPLLGAGGTNWQEIEQEAPEPLPYLDAQHLVEILKSCVEPESWDTVEGASIEVSGRWLGARHRPAVLDRIGEVLAGLGAGARRGLSVAVEVREAPAAAWPAAADDATRLESGSLSLPFGVTGVLRDTNRVTYVGDYDVEIAQGSMIADPVVVTAEEGLVVEAVAHPTNDGRRALVELLVQRAAYGPSRLAETGVDEEYLARPYRSPERLRNGQLELPVYDHLQAHVTTLVEGGGTFSVPFVLGNRLLEVRGRVGALPAPAAGPGVLPLGALSARPWSVAFTLPAEMDERDRSRSAPRPRFLGEDAEGPAGDPEYLVEAIKGTVAPRYWDQEGALRLLPGPGLWLQSREDVRDQVRAHLVEREAEALRPVAVELLVLSVPSVPAAGPGATVPREGARLLAGGRLVTLAGRRASLMGGSTANFLADYDVEVAQEARIADPIIGQAFDGLVANLTPRVATDGSTVTLDLQLLRSRRRIATEPFDSGTRYLGPVDRVTTDRAQVQALLQVPANGTYVVDLGRDPDDVSRRLALEVAATVR